MVQLWRIGHDVITTFAVNNAANGKPSESLAARTELAKAEAEWAAVHHGPAFDRLKSAWQHAQKAIQ